MCVCLSSAEAACGTEKVQKKIAMNKLAKILANYVIQKGAVKEDEKTVYEYGFLITLEAVLCLITCFGISLILHTISECILFFIIFIPLRSYAGGLHLDNYWSCFSLSCLTFFAIMMIDKYFDFPTYFTFVAFLLLAMAVYNMYPVENINREVDTDEDKQFKKRLQQFLVIDSIMAIIFFVLKRNTYMQTITMTFLMVTITMAIGKHKN